MDTNDYIPDIMPIIGGLKQIKCAKGLVAECSSGTMGCFDSSPLYCKDDTPPDDLRLWEINGGKRPTGLGPKPRPLNQKLTGLIPI